jgi:hypothetical protein
VGDTVDVANTPPGSAKTRRSASSSQDAAAHGIADANAHAESEPSGENLFPPDDTEPGMNEPPYEDPA